MTLSIVRLGSPRRPDEGTRIGTVRRPPRGVPKTEFARQNWYDVWFPNLAPSLPLMKQAQTASSEREWATFVTQFKAEMARPEAKHAIGLLAELSHSAHFSVGCYCEDERRCHRSVLRELLVGAGASIHPGPNDAA